MLIIVRLYPRTDINKVWDFVEKEIKDDSYEEITPLYATQSEGMMNIGLIFEVKGTDYMTKFITEDIVKCDEIHHTKTISLMKPIFFPIPKKKPETIHRYVIRVYAHPKQYKNVYDHLINHNYPFNLFPIYVSYSLGDEDIIMSLGADSEATVNKFVKSHIRQLDGVNQASYYPVYRAKRFASLAKLIEEQKEYLDKRSKSKSKDEFDYDFDWVENFEEHARLTGAFPGDY
ncbi:MAG: hypothetical protein R6V50_04580 [Thermoplasmatota archaeon]